MTKETLWNDSIFLSSSKTSHINLRSRLPKKVFKASLSPKCFWSEDIALMPLICNSNLKSQSLVSKHQIRFRNNSLVKLLNKNQSGWKRAAATVTRVENKFYSSIKTLWKYKAQSDNGCPHINIGLKIECISKLLMRCQCIVIVWVKTL